MTTILLKVLTSTKGNQYILVVQGYFSKWPFAFPMQDQKADTIVQILRDNNIFTVTDPPQKLHSDQGQNFESHIMPDVCKAIGVKKSWTTPYHPMSNGLLEHMNHSLLTLLHTYVEGEASGKNTYSYCYSSTELQDTPTLAYFPMKSCLAPILIIHRSQ